MKYLLERLQRYYLRLIVTALLAAWIAITPTASAALFQREITLSPTTNVTPQSVKTNQANITLVDRFEVQPENLESFQERWSALKNYMKQQPGFISAELSKTPVGSRTWVMSEKWDSLEAYKAAVYTEEFQSLLQNFPAKATWFAPELFPSK